MSGTVAEEEPRVEPGLRPLPAPHPGRVLLTGLALALGLEAAYVLVGPNFHAVEPGRVYRGAQPSPERLANLVRAYRVRTVITLRGYCAPLPWYVEQARVTHALDVAQEDVCFSAGHLPASQELRRLVEVLDRCEYPIYFHCHRGCDRTGLASAVYQLLHTGATPAEARAQLGLRYGHLPLGRPRYLDVFFDLYAGWLRGQGLEHTPAAFRRWAAEGYSPAACCCELEPLDAPTTVAAGEPFAFRVRARNTSDRAWRLRPENNAGFHLSFHLYDAYGQHRADGRAGLFEGEVAPGASIELALTVPGVRPPGRYKLVVDMVEEQHCYFHQAGSEPLLWELEVRP